MDDLPWFALIDRPRMYGIDESEEVEESWRVLALDEESEDDEIMGDGLGWSQAFAALQTIASDVGVRAPIQVLSESEEIDPVAVFNVDDGEAISVVRTATSIFAALGYADDDATEISVLGEWDDLGTAIVELAEKLGEPEFGEWEEDEGSAEE